MYTLLIPWGTGLPHPVLLDIYQARYPGCMQSTYPTKHTLGLDVYTIHCLFQAVNPFAFSQHDPSMETTLTMVSRGFWSSRGTNNIIPSPSTVQRLSSFKAQRPCTTDRAAGLRTSSRYVDICCFVFGEGAFRRRFLFLPPFPTARTVPVIV